MVLDCVVPSIVLLFPSEHVLVVLDKGQRT